MTEPTNLPNVIYSPEEREWSNEDVIVKLTPKDKLSGIKKLEYAWSETTDVPFNWIEIPLIKKPYAYGDFNSNADLITKNRTISPDPNAVYTLRPDGRFGGCVAVEEGTTNLAAGHDILFYNNDPNLWEITLTTLSETFMGKPIVRITLKPLTDAARDDVRFSYFAHGCRHSPGITFNANTTYTATIYWRCLKSSVQVEGSPSNIPGWGDYRTEEVGSGWKRSYAKWYDTTTMTDYGGKFWGIRDPLINTGETIVIDFVAPQIEAKPFATSFVDGTRAEGVLKYDPSILNKTHGTIAVWFKLHSLNTSYNPLITTSIALSPGPRLLIMREFQGVDANKLHVWDGDGSTEDVLTSTTVLQKDVWYHFAFTWSPSGRRLYINGSLEASNARSRPIGGSELRIGYWVLNDEFLNGLIDELLILPYAATEKEIQDLYLDRYPSYKVSQSTKGQWYLHTRIENNSGDIVTDYRGPYKIDKPTFVETRLGTALNLGMSDLQIKLPYSVNEYSVYMCRREKEEEDFHSIVILSDGRVYVDGFINLSYDISWFNFTGDTLTIGSKAWEIMELLIVKEIVPDLKIHEWAQHPTFFHDPAEDYNIQAPTIVDMEVL